jgi:sugar fermentation stimulation protein A
MKWSSPLIEGVFQKRYKRFFADVQLESEVVVAHIANTGSLKSVNVPGQPCLISPAANPERKLRFSLEMIQSVSGAWVGVNTSVPNAIVKEALELSINSKQGFSSWQSYDALQAEYKISKETRLDFALAKKTTDKKHFIEVKNVTLAVEKEGKLWAQFPDGVTERGQKHLRELMNLIDEGHTSEIVFTIQRNDCDYFSAADDIDPEYGRLLREAISKGVVVTPLLVELSVEGAILTEKKLEIKLA